MLKLPFSPNIKQKEALRAWKDDVTEEIIYGGAKNGGKSFLGGACIFHDALVYPETMYFIAREELGTLRKYTIPTIQELFTKWGISQSTYAPYNGQDNYFRCYNGSKVFLIECKANPSDPLFERFGSMQMTRGWIEEGGEVAELAKTNLGLSLGRWKNDTYNLLRKLLITCNPKKNWIKYNYIDPNNRGELPPSKKVILASVYDNKHRQAGSEKTLEDLTGTARQRLLLGKWDYDSDDDCLILGERILDMYSNDFVEPGGEPYIVADVARFGKDKTTIFVWKGFRLVAVEILTHSKIPDTAAAIKAKARIYNVPMSRVIVDEDGVGGGVVDILGCIGFVNNSSPLPNPEDQRKENYDNLKSQCGFMLADKVNKAEIFIEANLGEIEINGKTVKEMLNQELENIRQKAVDSDKKLGLMPKEKVKALIGRSPDFSDTMLMRMYGELEHAREWTIV